MNITDELRKHARGEAPHYEMAALLAIADRIDAEYESACAEAYGNGVMSVPIALDESAYVELPRDANGEYIHVGDEMDGYGKTIEVVELRIGRSGWVIVSRDGNAYADTFAFAHHKPPTVEDVLQELVVDWDCAPDGEDKAAVLKEYAARLQLKESE